MTLKYQGRFSIKIENIETGEIREYPEQENEVLDKYFSLQRLAESIRYLYCIFGTGATQVSRTDTSLGSLVSGFCSADLSLGEHAISATRTGNVFKVESTYELVGGLGAITGNISELGLSTGTTESGLFTRALIRDSQGNPTTISLGDLDSLTVYYTFGFTIDLTTPLISSKSAVINGVDTTISLSWVDYDISTSMYSLWNTVSPYANRLVSPSACVNRYQPFSGEIPNYGNTVGSLTLLGNSNNINDKYADGTLLGKRLINVNYPPGDATGVWNGLLFVAQDYSCATVALEFSPPITKGADDIINIDELIIGFTRGS